MRSFETWLKSRYRPSTVKHYLWELNRFAKQIKPQKATQAEILSYIDSYRQAGRSAEYLKSILAGLKAYYFYLVETEKREDHPCRYVKLRDKSPKEIAFQDLFTLEELEKLLKRKERYPVMAMRNQLILGLLIYQGLTVQEICKLRPADMDLENGKVHVPATSRSLSRTLKLEPKQILPAHLYVERDRKILLGKNDCEQLVLTSRGSAEKGEGIHYLIESAKRRWERRKLSPQTIRMSVIARWLKEGKNLRQVQYMAGHKKVTSTERYKQTDVKKLKALIDKFHPH